MPAPHDLDDLSDAVRGATLSEPAQAPAGGPADASVELIPRTIAELPFFSAGRFPKPDLLGQCRGGAVASVSGRDMVDRVRDLSLGLSSLGLSAGDRVALLSESRLEWLIVDLAILTAGAVTTPIYPTLSAEQVGFILRDSGASLVIVSSADQLAKLATQLPSLPALKMVVAIDASNASVGSLPVMSLDEVTARGHRRILDGWGVGRAFRDAARQVTPDDLATIIYTSGTTGQPKGVMLTHGNLVANLTGLFHVLDLHPDDIALSFLPLCHSFERIVSYVYLTNGVSMIFAESIDTIARDLLLVRPTVMSGVPRVFEKLQARVFEKGRAAGGMKRKVFEWAAAVADKRGQLLPAGRALPWSLKIASRIAEQQVFARVRAGIGGRLRYSVSGSAPLRTDIAQFFYGLGLPILEGYGLTETAPVLCVMPLGAVRFGTVGPPLPNVELKIADDGEVLARGPNVMRGYYGRPAETAAVMEGGWFHTGDVGALDEKGYLRITDRKKELLVTSGGKKIAPQPIEARLAADPLINEAVLVGDGRHFPAALLVPDFTALGVRLGAGAAALRARVGDADVRAVFEPIVDAVNASLSQFERIKKFAVLPDDFSIAGGQLTPTMKLKRRVIEQQYRTVIEGMYEETRSVP